MSKRDPSELAYPLDLIPSDVTTEQAEAWVGAAKNRYRQISSVATTEAMPVGIMLELSDASARNGTLDGGVIPGPLVLDGVVQAGNKIGLWRQYSEV